VDFGLDCLVGYALLDDIDLTAKFDLGLNDNSADPQFVTIYTRSFALCFVYLFPAGLSRLIQKMPPK
jgi:hypothetical protein